MQHSKFIFKINIKYVCIFKFLREYTSMYLMINEQDLVKDLLQESITSVNQMTIVSNQLNQNFYELFEKINILNRNL